MASVSYYRVEAERCRELAAHSPDVDMATRWRSLAADYEKLADALEASSVVMPSHGKTVQPQPMQQQQSKAEPEAEK
jgi:hypothetical protein